MATYKKDLQSQGWIHGVANRNLLSRGSLGVSGLKVFIKNATNVFQDRTGYIKKYSLEIEALRSSQANRATFTVEKSGIRFDFIPTIGKRVEIYFNAKLIFGGYVTHLEQVVKNYEIVEYTVECLDYTRFLDRKLVNESYQNWTVNQIIADIFETYLTGFDFNIDSVNCNNVISYVAFKYEPVSKCLDQLADLTQFQWWVDYHRNIYFVSKSFTQAPFEVKDDDGSCLNGSLIIRKDNSQVRNVVYVRGGEYLGDTFSSSFLADGVQVVFPVAYKYDTSDLKVTLTGQILNVGIEPSNTPSIYDVLYNPSTFSLRFRTVNAPTINSQITIAGRPYLPVITKVRDTASIAEFVSSEGGTGEYEFVIIDKSINSKEGARERAKAELLAYSMTLTEAEFDTYNDNLEAGQRITVNSFVQGINESYNINRITIRQWTNEALVYHVTLVSEKTLGIIDVLQKLLLAENKNIEVSSNEILDVVESNDEEMDLSDTVTANNVHNPQTETVSFGESNTVQSLDYNAQFCLGPQLPSGTKRLFIIQGSPLG